MGAQVTTRTAGRDEGNRLTIMARAPARTPGILHAFPALFGTQNLDSNLCTLPLALRAYHNTTTQIHYSVTYPARFTPRHDHYGRRRLQWDTLLVSTTTTPRHGRRSDPSRLRSQMLATTSAEQTSGAPCPCGRPASHFRSNSGYRSLVKLTRRRASVVRTACTSCRRTCSARRRG